MTAMRFSLLSTRNIIFLLLGILLIYNLPTVAPRVWELAQLSWEKVGPTLPFMLALLGCWGYVQAWRLRHRTRIRRIASVERAIRERAESLHSGFVGGMVAYGTLGTMYGVAQELSSSLQGMMEALNSTMVALMLAQIFYTYYLASKFNEMRKILHDSNSVDERLIGNGQEPDFSSAMDSYGSGGPGGNPVSDGRT